MKLNPIQTAAYRLIQYDLQYLYTIFQNKDIIKSNYIPSCLPYIGLIIDGTEDWICAISRSIMKMDISYFTSEEKFYYETLRNSTKLWQNDYLEVNRVLHKKYEESDYYFADICKPLAKILNLYDIFGVDIMNKKICGNTILCSYYSPGFSFYNSNGEYIQKMSRIIGEYIAHFEAFKELKINQTICFETKDFGGFIKSPVGNKFSYKFILLCVLCEINFLIYGVEQFIVSETPTKLRFAYMLYYYLLDFISQMNQFNATTFTLSDKWKSKRFRNAMAHYKLGVVLNEHEIIADDFMFGLTQKIFHNDYKTIKTKIISELFSLSEQITRYLKLH